MWLKGWKRLALKLKLNSEKQKNAKLQYKTTASIPHANKVVLKML